MMKRNDSAVKKLIGVIMQNHLLLVGALGSAIISGTMALYATRLSGRAIDLIVDVGKVDFVGLQRVAVTMAICFGVSAIFLWCMTVLSNKLALKTSFILRNRVFTKLMHAPISYFDRHSHGDIISRMSNDVDTISDGLLQVINKLFLGIVTLVGSLVFMLSINVPIALIVLIVTPLSILLVNVIRKRSAESFKKQSELQGKMNGFTEELMDSANLVMLYDHQKKAVDDFEQIDDQLYVHGFRSQYYSALANPMARFVNHIVYILVGVIGGFRVLYGGGMTIGDLSTFLLYAAQFAKPINEITSVSTQLQATAASAERIFTLLDMPQDVLDAPDAKKVTNFEGRVEFTNVDFSYDPAVKLIENLSFFAPAGATIAIVGPTGAGKTTLVNLLMRFYEIESGEITIDENNTKTLLRDGLRRQFGMVLQDSWLFHGTVRENIKYGRLNATDEEVVEAAKMSYAHNFIRRLPNGYDTIIDMDSGLSQGEMQLLTLARAMLTDPSLLILDEATSSIDTRTEQHIQKALLKMMKGRTSFVIAHRLSTIRNADLILVLRDGNIIEQGTHDELMAQESFYRTLHNSQFVS